MEIININTLQEALDLRQENKLVGLFYMPDEVYHSHELRALNQSGLLHFTKSPAHYMAWKRQPQTETPTLRFGKMFHMAILEPEKFNNTYAALEEKINLTTKRAKEKLAIFQEENPGKQIIKKSEFDQLINMQKSAYSHRYVPRFLSNGYAELACFWKDSGTGILCKCKFDYFNPELDLISDLKTTIDASEFHRSGAEYSYHVQNAWYVDAARHYFDIESTMIFIPIEKSDPYGIRLISLDPSDIQDGRELYKRYLDRFAECLEFNKWPSYSIEITSITLPRWKLV